jgi:hypothetical protein
MPFDRSESDYRAIELLLVDERMKGLFDRLMDAPNAPGHAEDWRKTIDQDPYLDTGLSLSHSEKARLRLACFFWNGSIPIRLEDPRRLDRQNRERFIAAYRRHLDLPDSVDDGVNYALRAMARAFEADGTSLGKMMAAGLRRRGGEDTQQEKDQALLDAHEADLAEQDRLAAEAAFRAEDQEGEKHEREELEEHVDPDAGVERAAERELEEKARAEEEAELAAHQGEAAWDAEQERKEQEQADRDRQREADLKAEGDPESGPQEGQ